MNPKAETVILAETQTTRDAKIVARSRILVVDDDLSVRQMLTRVLAGEGYLVSSAADGEEAVELAATEPIDLVLLDLNLPGKSGWDTLEQLTAQDPLLPAIIVTARSNQLFTAIGAGAGALLEKPLNFPKLLRTIRDLLCEPPETRMARMAGKPAEFHYQPTSKKDRTRGVL